MSECGQYKEISLDAINSNLFNYETIIKRYYVCDGTFIDTSCLYIYAILDRNNNEIIYVYLESPIGNKHNPYLDSKYLPINYYQNDNNNFVGLTIFSYICSQIDKTTRVKMTAKSEIQHPQSAICDANIRNFRNTQNFLTTYLD